MGRCSNDNPELFDPVVEDMQAIWQRVDREVSEEATIVEMAIKVSKARREAVYAYGLMKKLRDRLDGSGGRASDYYDAFMASQVAEATRDLAEQGFWAEVDAYASYKEGMVVPND